MFLRWWGRSNKIDGCIDVQFSLGVLELVLASPLSPGPEGTHEVSREIIFEHGGVNKHGAD